MKIKTAAEGRDESDVLLCAAAVRNREKQIRGSIERVHISAPVKIPIHETEYHGFCSGNVGCDRDIVAVTDSGD